MKNNPVTKNLLKNRAVTMRNRKQDYSRKGKSKWNYDAKEKG